MSHVLCLVSHVSCLMSHVLCLVSHVSHLMSYVSCLTSHVLCLVSHVSCLMSQISCLISHVSHLTSQIPLSHHQLPPLRSAVSQPCLHDVDTLRQNGGVESRLFLAQSPSFGGVRGGKYQSACDVENI